MEEVWQSRSSEKVSGSLFDRILAVRGFSDSESKEKLIAPKLKDLRDPLLIDGMDLAIDRLVEARRKNEPIAVYADFDLDGTSGLSLMELAFRQYGYENTLFYQPKRLSEGYGLHTHAIRELAENGVRVIVTVDVGITAIEAAEECRRLGLDLIITDHHLPKDKLPEAYAIVNPNKGSCPSGLGHMSGVGVAFYLAWALGRELKAQELLAQPMDLKSLLDVFVIGTLTDLVPLKDENRVLIKHGLLQLEKTKRPLLAKLIEKLGLAGRPLSSADVAMQIAPKLNALSRLELGLMPKDILALDVSGNLDEIIETVLSSNEMRKDLQRGALEVATEMALSHPDSPVVFVHSPDFHKGVIGLIATQLSREYNRPAFVGHSDESGLIHGSARIPDGSAVNLAALLAEVPGLVIRAGGHAAAAGFVVEVNKSEALRLELSERVKQVIHAVQKKVYDVEAMLQELDHEFMKHYSYLEPFGKDFSPALLKIAGALITSRKELKGGHLKLSLTQKARSLDALAFSPQLEWLEIQNGECVDALVEPQWNYFRGQRQIQLLVRSLKRVSN